MYKYISSLNFDFRVLDNPPSNLLQAVHLSGKRFVYGLPAYIKAWVTELAGWTRI